MSLCRQQWPLCERTSRCKSSVETPRSADGASAEDEDRARGSSGLRNNNNTNQNNNNNNNTKKENNTNTNNNNSLLATQTKSVGLAQTRNVIIVGTEVILIMAGIIPFL